MAGRDMMEQVDMKAQLPKMNATDQHFIRKAQEITLARGLAQKTLRKRNLMLAGGLFLAAGAIYTYTIKAVKQEKFLDEYDDMHKKG